MTPLDLDDIQGNVLRGYRMRNARHFALVGSDAAAAARFISTLVDPPDAAPGAPAPPRITSATTWDAKPHDCLNLGVTAAGLSFLGVSAATMALFPAAYTAGAAARAASLGDTDEAAPAHWLLGAPAAGAEGGGSPGMAPEQFVLSLYTDEHRVQRLDALSAQLRVLMAAHGIHELSAHDAMSFAHGAVHFGYRDGIGQPRIAGAPGKQAPDMQPASEPGEFLLGADHRNQFAGNWIGDLPPALCTNATYGALRIIRQDVAAFERFITRAATRLEVEREWIAAKLMGRWRNGVPLMMSPDGAEPTPPIPPGQLDDFDYVTPPGRPMLVDDSLGLRCPVGAHIRRLNPRGALVMGHPYTRRIIRRGMPYGPEFDPAKPDDGVERGLMGYFLCGDLEMQFEFLLRIWANSDYATAGLRGTRDPILGAQSDAGGRMTIRTPNALDPVTLDDLPRWSVTRGCLYCLLPGLNGLRHLAAAGGRPA